MPQNHPWKDHVSALAEMFGNCGWMEGTMADIVGLAVDTILMTSAPKEE